MRLALDTNLLVYAEGEGDALRCGLARTLTQRLQVQRVVLPVQVLGELHHVLARKYRWPAARVGAVVREWAELYGACDSTRTAFEAALELAAAHGLPIWDALILSVAAEQRCLALITEDLQPGFSWRGVTVVNPFTTPVHPVLAGLMD